ncbi:cation:proton antiporter [Desertifilum sp. FACHB-1129]|uniref:Sodium:proton antiporter n=1 Tax=Desertifilum tharense IPPAS B-1220 TaxID=1781255 RepID=A0A1E5QN23_9CYAN|nr:MULTISPECIES: cation:proton antiporter [Desertifilum]MDA0208575.1 cation:proton antiporter [Cyanobacteria bacterium FC1]MBD2312397.1 cation:proton antiporter [Desertifilum sp. FACHB-1129]MBD2321180.1 cation:proton antiporter [Desertifilum sp. FACHB-866]MBD2331513.1 cation:proton antiporter [Desertifilum sp. FACHB-868]OEJ76028.1 sodium:proton antiporter [Desertifilum tharense IPPAS B-1220]
MEGSFEITLLIILTVTAGIGAQVLADYLKVPAIVFLLLFGILLGSDGLNLVHPHQLGIGLEVIVALAVALILFEGGLNLELRELGKVSGSLRNLVTIGTLITLIGGGIAAHYLSEFPWSISFLYASLVVVTGPTVISPLLKHVSVQRPVAALLEGEGVLIDPVGAILAVVVLDIILNGDADPTAVVSGLLIRLGIGVGIGAVGGGLVGLFIKRANFLSEDLKNLVVLASLLALFGLAQEIRSESGLMATVVSGIVLRASSLPEERLLRRFKGQLTLLAVSVLFILLAADLSIASIVALGWGSVGTVLVLMFAVRPLNVLICTWNSDLNWRQKLFISWIGPRGIVSASVASLFGILLTERGINGGDATKALVFLTIIMTVVCQGLTASLMARLLKITSTQATGVIIVGIHPLSRLIARLYQEKGESVVLIDTDAEACRQAQQEGLRVFLSSALDTGVLEEAGLSSVGSFLVMTNNGEVNLVLAQRAIEEFSPPRVYAVFPRDPQASSNNQKNKVNQAFASQLAIKTWNQYITDGKIKLGTTTLKEEGFAFQQAHLQALVRAGELVPLLVEREERLQVVTASEEWRLGDRIIYVLHDPRPQLLKRLSGASQSKRLSLEKLSEVEEIPLPVAMSMSAETILQPVEELEQEPIEVLPPPS